MIKKLYARKQRQTMNSILFRGESLLFVIFHASGAALKYQPKEGNEEGVMSHSVDTSLNFVTSYYYDASRTWLRAQNQTQKN